MTAQEIIKRVESACVRLDDAVGKTIAKVDENVEHKRTLALAFTDGTYTRLSVEYKSVDSGDLCASDDPLVLPWDRHEALRLGVITVAEFDVMSTEHEREAAAERERNERAELARLKAKYEGAA